MKRSTALAVAAALAVLAPVGALAAPAFDRAGWLSDYAFLKTQLEASYSHLAWFGSPEAGVDLPALDRRTLRALNVAESDLEARQAISAFVLALHDGHFSELGTASPSAASPTPEPARRDLSTDDAVGGCAALGYADKSPDAFTLPFESLPGFKLTADGEATGFRAGVATLDGRSVGVVRIRSFGMKQYPDACIRAWKTHPDLDKSRNAFAEAVTDAWFESLARQLKAFKAQGVQAVLVDVGGNGGGDDSGDWAPRLFSDKPVRSARLLMAAGPVGETYLDEQIEQADAAMEMDKSAATRTTASKARAYFQARKAELPSRRCDMSWVWRERRAFDPAGCSRLVEAGYASGAVAWLSADGWTDRRAGARVYWPANIEPWRGAWTGKTYVLTNGASYSSAEMFTATMRDNGLARTLGAKTGGDGCGFMEDTDPVVLPASRMRFRVPNCVRLRADGTDEVAGIAADVPLPAMEGESARARAMKALNAVLADAK